MKTKINIAICDDSKLILEIAHSKLIQILSQVQFTDYEIYLFDSSYDLLHKYKQFDIILLDIEMPGLDGLTLAKKINDSERQPLIIFITSYREFMLQGYHVRAFRYLTKPFADKDFNEAITSAIDERLRINTIIVQHSDKNILIDTKDIIFIESLGESSCLHYSNSEYIQKETMKQWLIKLPPSIFVQTHRSYIINLKHVDNVTPSQILMKNGCKVPVSFRKRKEFNNALHIYIKSSQRR